MLTLLTSNQLELLVLSSACKFQARPGSSKLVCHDRRRYAEGLPTMGIIGLEDWKEVRVRIVAVA